MFEVRCSKFEVVVAATFPDVILQSHNFEYHTSLISASQIQDLIFLFIPEFMDFSLNLSSFFRL